MSLTFSEFDPSLIAWQDTFLDESMTEHDFSMGYHQYLLSGSVGSAKTTLTAHVVSRRALEYPGSHIMIGRRSLPDLKGTLYSAILDHLSQPDLIPQFRANDTRALIKFKNGSVIRGMSWADKRFKKVRSYEFDMIVIEEGTENGEDEYELYKESVMRLRRMVKLEDAEKEYDDEGVLIEPQSDPALGETRVRPLYQTAPRMMIVATNPDSPAHWLYRHFMESNSPTRHVYYSLTADNPFLAPGYIEQQKEDLDPKRARRMLYGEWIDIRDEVIYYAYDPTIHFLKTTDYKIDPRLPIKISFDFNIGVGKPMSTVAAQYTPHTDTFHGFDETIIEGSRTESTMEEWASRGLFEHDTIFHIHGDATGAAQSTNSIRSNYEIIRNFLSNYRTKDGRALRFEMKVPKANPPIMTRHNRMNQYFMNERRQSRIRLYQRLTTSSKGFLLTALKKGASYIEDDSKDYQHVTTAWGYMVTWVYNEKSVQRGEVRGR